jgi:signal transduction histidine kinase
MADSPPTAQSATSTGTTNAMIPPSERGFPSTSAHGQRGGSNGRSGHSLASLVRSLPHRGRTVTALRWQVLAAGLAVLIIAWAVAIVTIPGARFAVTAPVAQAGVEAASALARLFAALVLFLFPTERSGPRLHWVAGGLVVLGLGGLVFGYIPALLGAHAPLTTSIYEGLGVRTVADLLFAVGLLLRTPPPFTRRFMALTLILFATLSALAMTLGNDAPALVHIGNLAVAAARGEMHAQGFTAWYWVLSAIPLILAALTALGAARAVQDRTVGGWLVVGMVLLAGSQLHNMFWPSVYSPVLTTADLLRLAFAVVVTIGAIVELRAIAGRRAALLAAEQEQSRRLAELGVLKANFTAMVAHELSSPLAAIRRVADLLDSGHLDQRTALDTIRSETGMLATLVDDVQTSSCKWSVFAATKSPPPPAASRPESALPSAC